MGSTFLKSLANFLFSNTFKSMLGWVIWPGFWIKVFMQIPTQNCSNPLIFFFCQIDVVISQATLIPCTKQCATPLATHSFKIYHKMDHPSQLLVSLNALPSFEATSKGAKIRLLKSVFFQLKIKSLGAHWQFLCHFIY